MHLLNRVSLIGWSAENPNIYWVGNNESIAIFRLYTCDSLRYGQEKPNERPQRTDTYVRTASDVLTNPDLEVARVHTEMEEKGKYHQHNILVKAPLMVEYANSCLSKGDLVLVEGRLEPMSIESGNHAHSWIVIDENQGVLHPLYSGAKVFQ